MITIIVVLPCIAASAAPPITLDTTIHHLEDRRVIVERTTPITVPDPPEPVTREAAAPATSEQLGQLTKAWRTHRATHPWIHAGATVYRLPDGETRTRVTTWQVNNGDPVSFWSSADFSLLAHPGSFTTPEGINYSMLLMHTIHDVAQWQDFASRRGANYKPPAIPEFPAGPATWIPENESTSENQPDAAEVAAADAIHAHYRANLIELQADYAVREAERAVRCAELEANPPQPRDIHLRVSRLSREQAAAWHRHAVERKGGTI